jgi:hypothetical protein
MVVRPKNGKYTLVGPAYVHGIMNGEAWSNDEYGLEKFTLV